MAEFRAEAGRIVGYQQISTWGPPQDVLRAQFYHLEQQFFHHWVLDAEAWLYLAEDYAMRKRIQ